MKKSKNDSKKYLTKVQKLIEEECDYIKELLIDKNKSYGNSAIEPIRIFSSCDADEALKVRIDDKLSRISYGHEYINESTTEDILGYLILLRVQKVLKDGSKKKRKLR